MAKIWISYRKDFIFPSPSVRIVDRGRGIIEVTGEMKQGEWKYHANIQGLPEELASPQYDYTNGWFKTNAEEYNLPLYK